MRPVRMQSKLTQAILVLPVIALIASAFFSLIYPAPDLSVWTTDDQSPATVLGPEGHVEPTTAGGCLLRGNRYAELGEFELEWTHLQRGRPGHVLPLVGPWLVTRSHFAPTHNRQGGSSWSGLTAR